MQKILILLIIGTSLLVSNNAFAEKSYGVNIPTGAGSPEAPYFWQSEKDGNTKGVIDIILGDTITWKNADTVQHTVVSGNPNDGPDGIFDSGLIKTGGSFSYKFTKEGKYDYFCSIHPWMTGVVTVGFTYQKIPHVGESVGDGTKFYDVEYLFDRLVTVNNIDTKSNSIMFELVGKANSDEANLILRLPTDLIDGPFVVWIDENSVNFKQDAEKGMSVLTIPVSPSSKIVTVTGTHVVPEFGSYVMIMLVISTVLVLYFTRSVFTKKWNMIISD
ncbi:MAG TPA: plastocyanin/azurin family copper-binding protein [Nitrosarchaeum sp.]|nr:plastocyanin/azurin family copper-binding protein [Nitrosarchaeum sp.]